VALLLAAPDSPPSPLPLIWTESLGVTHELMITPALARMLEGVDRATRRLETMRQHNGVFADLDGDRKLTNGVIDRKADNRSEAPKQAERPVGLVPSMPLILGLGNAWPAGDTS
jgi:hypothetical protein